MKQLITRIDDQLHARLKRRAAAEGRSVNALVTQALEELAPPLDPREALREKIRAAGLLAEVPPQPSEEPPSLDEVIAMNRGSGPALSEALERDRDGR